jgi:hypothetical protein
VECGFPDWPTWQIYFAVSVSLTAAYRVSVLSYFQSTKKKAFKKTWFHYQRSRKWTLVFLSIFESFISENKIQLNLELAAIVRNSPQTSRNTFQKI